MTVGSPMPTAIKKQRSHHGKNMISMLFRLKHDAPYLLRNQTPIHRPVFTTPFINTSPTIATNQSATNYRQIWDIFILLQLYFSFSSLTPCAPTHQKSNFLEPNYNCNATAIDIIEFTGGECSLSPTSNPVFWLPHHVPSYAVSPSCRPHPNWTKKC